MKRSKTEQPELGLTVEAAEKKQPVWNLVTNHRNLFYMLAAGLIMPPKGFLKKYYADPLSVYPGWVPLTNGSVPSNFIQKATSERDWLKPCIITISIDTLSGDIHSINNNGESAEVNFPTSDISNIDLLLIPAPLPAGWIESITFQNKEDKDSCLAEAEDLSNVPLKQYKIKTNASAFKPKKSIEHAVRSFSEEDYNLSPDKSLAYGAMLAMLTQFTEYSALASKVTQTAFSPVQYPDTTEDPILTPLSSWITQDLQPEQMDTVSAKIFWGAVNHLASNRSKEGSMPALDELLEYLESVSSDMQSSHKDRLYSLIQDIKAVAGIGDSSISELFKRNNRPLSRAMVVFSLRDTCTDLINFKEESLTENDLVLAAILFSARDGWMGLPLDLRGTTQKMTHAIEHRMASMAHQLSGSNIQLGEPPSRPRVLRELFSLTDNQWSKKQMNAALNLARSMKWDCIRTTITLAKGDYQMHIDGKGIHIEFDGEVKAVNASVDPTLFLEKISSSSIKPNFLKKTYADLGEEVAQ
ncbi:MAG: hypothetical protein H7A51_06705 [Akkermansiaceae bacterium]|nr:hypothetical protein [Akkermansiaceae bacterium]